jgi:uncharacterized protein (DUF924 family)
MTKINPILKTGYKFMHTIDEKAQEILDFWFNQHNFDDWFTQNDTFDNHIKTEFSNLHLDALTGLLHHWRTTPHGSLAEIIIFDQFSRHIYRNDIRSYLSDEAALTLSNTLIKNNFDKELNANEKLFAYLPFMHSEKLDIQKKGLLFFASLGSPQVYDYAKKHHDVIKQFGRFPHRNIILRRQSSQAELDYLQEFPNGF